MDVRIVDLDGSLAFQRELIPCHPRLLPAQTWGPGIRLGCSFGRFRRFEQALADLLPPLADGSPRLVFYGSGDFHHVSLALMRQLRRPFNLLVLDNHPDWMRGVPLLHCGTWLYHAARLPHLQRVFHVGGEVDFDNSYRWLTPWRLLRSGKITVIPALRRFQRGPWAQIAHKPLRAEAQAPASAGRVEELLRPFRDDLARWPLYISLDKDVMTDAHAVVNWDSGQLALDEVCHILRAFVQHARGCLAGMDIVGEWSPVRVQGMFRRALHWTEHPALAINARNAARLNERTNLILLQTILSAAGKTAEASTSAA
jgi:arginase family enzyme